MCVRFVNIDQTAAQLIRFPGQFFLVSPARFVNNRCVQNANKIRESRSRLSIKPVCGIKVGEEVTVSYGRECFGSGKGDCRCRTYSVDACPDYEKGSLWRSMNLARRKEIESTICGWWYVKRYLQTQANGPYYDPGLCHCFWQSAGEVCRMIISIPYHIQDKMKRTNTDGGSGDASVDSTKTCLTTRHIVNPNTCQFYNLNQSVSMVVYPPPRAQLLKIDY
jgi:hypothetical protein